MKVKSRKLKDMRIALIGLLLLGCVPLMAAKNPSAKNPAQKKTTLLESLFGGNGAKATGKTVQFTPTKSVSVPSSSAPSASSGAPVVALPSAQGNSLLRHTATPVVAAPRSTGSMQGSAGSIRSVFGSLSSDRAKRQGGSSGGGFSGGSAAGGLMNSGSRYSGGSSANGGGVSVSTLSISDGPRKDPIDPFLDEEEEDDVPIGDGMWVMMLLAGAFAVARKWKVESGKWKEDERESCI